MKRFIGLCLAIAGGALVLWGGIHCMTGQASHTIFATNDFAVTAMAGGLAGAAIFTVGLVWTRD